MNKILSIFPIDRNTAPLARYACLLLKYDVLPLLPISSSTLDGKDLSELDGGSFADIKLTLYGQNKISDSDIVYLTDSTFIKDNCLYLKIIKYAKEMQKEIIISNKLMIRLGLSEDSHINFEKYYDESPRPRLIEIDVPIISIFTSGKNCDQPNIELSLRKFFVDKGYKVTQIGTQTYSRLFGFSTVPNFISQPNIDATKKIIMFNRFANELIKSENPDLLIIGVPEGIMKYNNEILNGLGVTPYIIQHAVKSDVGILSLYQETYPKKYFDEMVLYCRYTFGIAPKYFNIANTKVEKNIDDNSIIEYLPVNSHFVLTQVDTSAQDKDTIIFNSLDPAGLEKTYQLIENELISNITHV